LSITLVSVRKLGAVVASRLTSPPFYAMRTGIDAIEARIRSNILNV